MKRSPLGKYVGIRKMRWDGLWHAIWIFENDENKVEHWDRVSEERAMEIVAKLWED